MSKRRYEDAPEFTATAYRVEGYAGVAWYVRGWELETKMNDECTDVDYERTGQLVCTMVGDDRHFAFDPEDLTPLTEDEYCAGCGQIGCGH